MKKRVQLLNWPICRTDLSLRENVKIFYNNNHPVLLRTFRCVCIAKGDKLTTETLDCIVSAITEDLLSIVRRNYNIKKCHKLYCRNSSSVASLKYKY